MDGTCRTHAKKRDAYKILVPKSEGEITSET
jgi:hypothetical protein